MDAGADGAGFGNSETAAPWTPFVRSLALQPDGKVVLGGDFGALQPNGGAPVTRLRIARVNADGTIDPVFNPNANGQVSNVALQTDGKALLGGIFTTLQPNGAALATARQNIARVMPAGRSTLLSIPRRTAESPAWLYRRMAKCCSAAASPRSSPTARAWLSRAAALPGY